MIKRLWSNFLTLLAVVFQSVIWSICSGLIFFMSITSLLQAPIITVFVTLCFSLFHLSDFQTFFKNRDWFIILGRFTCLLLMSSFLTGMFRLAFEAVEFNSLIPPVLSLAVLIVSFFVLLVYNFNLAFRPDGALLKKLETIVEGSKRYGIFWDY